MKEYRCPILRFFLDSAGVFEMICKIILAVIVIPWGSLFLNGLILDKWLHVVDGSDFWVVTIAVIAIGLFGFGIYLTVTAIRRYVRKKRKGIPTAADREGRE